MSAPASAPAKINSFTASLLTIDAGQSVTLSWNVSNAPSVSIDQGIGSRPPVDSMTVSPGVTTTYKLTATGGGSTATASVTVTVQSTALDIVFFNADPEEVPSEGTSRLSWKTIGAAEVRITPVIGTVEPEGEIDVMVSGEHTYVFTLTATDGATTVNATVQIESYLMMPNQYTTIVNTVLSESGYVRSTGVPWPNYIYVGDDNNDVSIQGFVSFDISDIPEDAVITDVVVNLSNRESTYGSPFDDLGCLRAYVQDYGLLDGGDYFNGMAAGAIGRWCNEGQLDAVDGGYNEGFKDALQAKVGGDRFQVRLQFKEKASDNDGKNDLLRWHGSKLPTMTVQYYSYE